GTTTLDLTGAQVSFVSSTQLAVSVNLGTSPVDWNAQVFNPGGQSSNVFSFSVVSQIEQPANTTSFALPQLAFGGGWYTALYFSNISGNSVSFPVKFMSDDGSSLSVPLVGIGPVSAQTVNLSAGATTILEAPNVGNLVQGWVETTLPPGVVGYAI